MFGSWKDQGSDSCTRNYHHGSHLLLAEGNVLANEMASSDQSMPLHWT